MYLAGPSNTKAQGKDFCITNSDLPEAKIIYDNSNSSNNVSLEQTFHKNFKSTKAMCPLPVLTRLKFNIKFLDFSAAFVAENFM
jgi:hypothetical protein